MPPQPWNSATAGAGDADTGNQKAVSTTGALASPSRLGNETRSCACSGARKVAATRPTIIRNTVRRSGIGARGRPDRRRIGVDARHREGIDVAPVAHRVAAVPALRFEAELAIQGDRRGVVDVDR